MSYSRIFSLFALYANAFLELEDGLLAARLHLRAESLFLRKKPRRLKQSTGLFLRTAFDSLTEGKIYSNECPDTHLNKCLRAESNHRHGVFQSPALPTELQRRFLQRLFSILYSLGNVNNFFQKFLYILQAGRKQSQKLSLRLFHFSLPVCGGFVPQQVRRSILFHAEQPHGAAQNSSSETRLLYVCLVIYTVCRLPCRFKCRIAFSANLIIRRYGSRQTDL